MSRLIDRLSMFDHRSNSMANDEEIAHSGLLVAPRSPTLGELLHRVGDSCRYDGAGGTPDSQILDLDGMTTIDRGPVPFVLTFTNLTYRIKNPTRKISPSRVFRRRRSNRLATADFPAEAEAEVEPKASAAVPGRTKTLLDGISGEARDGEIMAVLGASGSGKSTLIDALANRISKDSLKGTVTLNGARLESRLLKTISAYVMQDDLLYPMLTVEETLTFAAEFRLPRSLPPSRKKARVQALIDQLGLRAAAQTIIGDEGHRGVSGGERRRVSIGTDIIHDPIILFLDEPTSGLDSTSAFMVVKVLQRIARSGSIVVMSIHQPSSRIINLLDRVLFLSRGQTVYSGSPDGLPLFFADAGYPIPEKESRTEFALDLIRELEGSIPSGTKPLVDLNRSRQQPMKLHTNESPFSAQSLKDAISASISRGKLVSGASDGTVTVSSSVPMFANPFWTEVAVLTRRSFTNSRRQPKILSIRLVSVMVTGFILATIFWHVDDSPKGVQERLGFFAFGMSTMFYSCADALPVFIQERYIFMRETAYNAYRRSSYVLANAAVGFPPLVALSVGFTVTTFFAVGLSGGAMGFLFYFLIVLASFWAGSGFVTFLSATVSHVMLGYVMVVAILAYFLLFSGFFIQRDRIPDYWIWFHYLSLVKYPFEAVLQNEFGDSGKCFSRGVQMFDNTPLASLPSVLKAGVLKSISGSLGVEITTQTCVTTGADILKQQGITQLSKWSCLLVTVAWGFLYRFLFYFALLVGSKNKRS